MLGKTTRRRRAAGPLWLAGMDRCYSVRSTVLLQNPPTPGLGRKPKSLLLNHPDSPTPLSSAVHHQSTTLPTQTHKHTSTHTNKHTLFSLSRFLVLSHSGRCLQLWLTANTTPVLNQPPCSPFSLSRTRSDDCGCGRTACCNWTLFALLALGKATAAATASQPCLGSFFFFFFLRRTNSFAAYYGALLLAVFGNPFELWRLIQLSLSSLFALPFQSSLVRKKRQIQKPNLAHLLLLNLQREAFCCFD